MTDILAVALAVTLTVADGVIAALGRQLAEADAGTRLLIHALASTTDTLHRYGLLP